MRTNRDSMAQINRDISVQADIKADVFTQIFDNMTKNMKDNEQIFFIFNKKQLKIWIQQKFKTTQLQLRMDSRSFSNYNCSSNGNSYQYRKYELKDFMYFNVFFQSCKGLLKLQITQTQIQFKDCKDTSNKISGFTVPGLQITQQQEDDLQQNNKQSNLNDQKNFCKLILPKSKSFQEVIHSGNAMKIDKLFLSYDSNGKKLIFQCKQQKGSRLKINVEQQKTKGAPLSKIGFNFKKLKLATGLLQSQKACKLMLSSKALIIDYDQQGKKRYNISILADVNN